VGGTYYPCKAVITGGNGQTCMVWKTVKARRDIQKGKENGPSGITGSERGKSSKGGGAGDRRGEREEEKVTTGIVLNKGRERRKERQ